MSDPVADLLTRIRNASQAQKKYTVAPYSKLKEQVLKILQQKGFIEGFKLSKEGVKANLKIMLKYDDNRQAIIKSLKRSSKPGQRKYVKAADIPIVLGGIGISIVSTSQGVMDGDTARRKKIGGELLCVAW